MLYVTHDRDEAVEVSDRILHMQSGRIVKKPEEGGRSRS
jgi:ABC-type Fe3+/spermidine/putrescine transport system ATPase subunit